MLKQETNKTRNKLAKQKKGKVDFKHILNRLSLYPVFTLE